MERPSAVVLDEDILVLTDLPPSAAQKRLAFALVLGSLAVFVLIAFGPLKGVFLRRVDAFIPAYVAAMFVCNSITAILLYAQFSILRSRAILVIASGYLFAALVLIPFVLVYPGVFVPRAGLFGGAQSTSWIWCLWHAGFPLFVISYALLKEDAISSRSWRGTVRAQISLSVISIASVVCAATLFFIAGSALLPEVASDDRYFTPLWPYFIGAPAALASFSALVVLWVRRHSMLDLWLIVVICLYLIEIALAYYPHPMRFSVGSYATRVIGFLASSLVLAVLLYETTSLYSRLVGAIRAQTRERVARMMTGDAVAAAIAHEVKQPLSGMVTNADAGLRFLNRATPNVDEAKEAFTQISADGHRAGAVIGNIRTIFKKDAVNQTLVDPNSLVQETLALVRDDLNKHRISVKAELSDTLPCVMGNRIQLQQVLVNLITNAIDSMTAAGGSRVLFVRTDQDAGNVKVSVADTGKGILQQDTDRVFNPLYTTKPDGMGMGLSICRSIVEAHNGRLWAAPNRPRGTVFHFTLSYSKTA